MSRTVRERMASVRGLLEAARAVHDERARLAPAVARATGLTPQGVELGFAFLERDATDGELRELVARAGEASSVHVILSANVFVAPLRALAIARAASARVTVRPSPRDPTLTRALVESAADEALTIVDERDVAAVEAAEIHVYGRNETIAEVRTRAHPNVVVRGHGTGLGLAFVTCEKDIAAAAEAIAADVLPFDQRGCLSPRVVLFEGNELGAQELARTLHEQLSVQGERVPRGPLFEPERTQSARWRDTLAFAGRVWSGAHHTVAVGPSHAPPIVPPPGRHVYVAAVRTLEDAIDRMAPLRRFVVAVGTDDPRRLAALAPWRARIAPLGKMQRPPLDGPVDRRSF
jgi:hypothetical protein